MNYVVMVATIFMVTAAYPAWGAASIVPPTDEKKSLESKLNTAIWSNNVSEIKKILANGYPANAVFYRAVGAHIIKNINLFKLFLPFIKVDEPVDSQHEPIDMYIASQIGLAQEQLSKTPSHAAKAALSHQIEQMIEALRLVEDLK